MKTKFLFFIITLLALSCSKKEVENQDTLSIDSELVGKWQVIADYDDIITPEEEESGISDQPIENGRIIEFKNDGTHINLYEGYCEYGIFTSNLDQNELFASCEDEILNDHPLWIFIHDSGKLTIAGSEFGGEIFERVSQ